MSPPLRITFLITDLEVGGAEKFMVELLCRLNRQVFDPHVVVLSGVPHRRHLLDRLDRCQIPVSFLRVRNLFSLPGGVAKLVRHLRTFRPKILQSFLFHANFLGRLAAKVAGVPTVICGIRVAEREHPWHLWLDRLTATWVDRYVCVSEAVAKFSAEVGMLPESKLTVIPNAVDVAAIRCQNPADLGKLFQPHWGGSRQVSHETRFGERVCAIEHVGADVQPVASETGQFYMVAVGRLERQKGFDWLLMTLAPLLRKIRDLRLVIVGSGPQEERLLSIIARERIEENVRLMGFRDDAQAIIRACDLFLLSSLWEGMPNALLEAMAAGKPVVCVEVEGVREVLGPLCEDQLIRDRNQDEFRRAILKHYRDRKYGALLGRRNQRQVEERFNWSRVVEQYESLWLSYLD
ncbi:glycosyltransferase [Thermogutta sp.]|uniref:glycosyltransferase n=1 Tax=Thermogutta sp. TaxID=1962930 RepID=UPI003C7BA267